MFHTAAIRKPLPRLVGIILTMCVLLGTAAPALALEDVSSRETAEPHCPSCLTRDAKIRSLTVMVSALETENARLVATNRSLRAKITRQAKTIRRATGRIRGLMRQVSLLLRELSQIFGPWRRSVASWYGPGFYGSGLAGGGVLRPNMRIFAHRTMRFGTKVQFMYRGRKVIAVAKDRGPFISGREFDLGPGTARALGFDGVGSVRWRIVKR